MKWLTFQQMQLLTIFVIFTTCWNGSMVDTNSKDKRPDVNYYGILKDHSNKETSVEDILIAGRYQNIPVYQTQEKSTKTNEKSDLDIKTNKSLLDLSDILSIELAHPDKPIEHLIINNNNKFCEIIVTTIKGTIQHYLIESNRELSCVKIDKGSEKNSEPILEERKLQMIHVRQITIKGQKGAVDKGKNYTKTKADESDSSKIAEKTEKIIDELEKNVESLNNKTNFETFKHSVAQLLRALRDQLQKMLALIKN